MATGCGSTFTHGSPGADRLAGTPNGGVRHQKGPSQPGPDGCPTASPTREPISVLDHGRFPTTDGPRCPIGRAIAERSRFERSAGLVCQGRARRSSQVRPSGPTDLIQNYVEIPAIVDVEEPGGVLGGSQVAGDP